ncbi:MAG: transcriptional regulator, partial [Nitrospinota bacterium]
MAAEENSTLRRRIIELLSGRTLSTRQISQILGITERDVLGHLDHVARSVAPKQRLVMELPVCRRCGFSFRKREKW